MQTTHRPRFTALALAAVLTLTSCGGEAADDERPAVSSWAVAWDEHRQMVPIAEAIRNGGQDLCGERLGVLRTEMPTLRPAPTDQLDDALEDWITLAETIMFECPSDPAILDEQLQELDVLAAEVDAALEATDG